MKGDFHWLFLDSQHGSQISIHRVRCPLGVADADFA
jgi:hypothetical protein